jgi:hypothetical protein
VRQTARWWWWWWYEGVSKIFRTDAVKIINLTTKRVWNLPTSTQLRATWHIDSLDMVDLPFYRCFALPQLLCRWRHQSWIFWIHLVWRSLLVPWWRCSNQCLESVSSQNISCSTQFLLWQVGRRLPHQLQPRGLLHPTAGYCTYTGGSLPTKCRDDMRHFPGIRGRTKDVGGSSNAVGGISVWTA